MDNSDLRKTYNKIAKDYAKDHQNDTWDDDYIEAFALALPKNAKVLDLGCGPGAESKKLVNKGLNIEGFDLSDELLTIARQTNPTLTFTQGDMRKLPYPDETFDGVFSKASLLHIAREDIDTVLAGVCRILKKGGVFHVVVKGGDGEGKLTEDDYGYSYSRFFSYWRMEELLNILTKHNFSIEKSDVFRRTETGYTVWLKVLAKKV